MRFRDGFVNFVSGLGGALGKNAGVAYQVIAEDTAQNEAMYRTSWSGRRVVDIPSADMTRKWRVWTDDPELMADVEHSLGLRQMVRDGIALAKRRGGAAIYIGTGDGDEGEPLTDVERGGIQFLTLFTRNELTIAEWDMDPMSPRYRMGKFYSVNRGDGPDLRIHWSRFIWFSGAPTASDVREVNGGWDDSVYTYLGDLVKTVDSALADIAALLPEARVDVLSIPDLAAHFEDQDSEARLSSRVMTTQRLKSITQMLVIDGGETYEQKATNFSGVVEVFRASLEALGAASDIPVVRFLGTTNAGLNNSSDTALRTYYDGIASRQVNELGPSLKAFDRLLYKHATGQELDGAGYEWNPLWELTEREVAEIAKIEAETTNIYVNAGLFDPETLAMLVANQLRERKLYPGFDAVLEEAGDALIRIEEPRDPEQTDPNEADTEQVRGASPEGDA